MTPDRASFLRSQLWSLCERAWLHKKMLSFFSEFFSLFNSSPKPGKTPSHWSDELELSEGEEAVGASHSWLVGARTEHD